MELFDKARNKALNPITILKVFLTHEENIRTSFIEFCKTKLPTENINEENVFDFIDTKLTEPNTASSMEEFSELKKVFDDFCSFSNEFLISENLLEDNIYKIGYNERIEKDLKTFCLSEDLAGSMVMKAKQPTISNTDLQKKLNISEVLKSTSINFTILI